jgi:hypothetical protein
VRHLLPSIRRVVRRGTRTVVDLSQSANLYLTSEQGHEYETVLASRHYRESVVTPLAMGAAMLPCLLKSIAGAKGSERITVIDCGPATAEESVRKLHSLLQAVTVLKYVVVDVNSLLLSKVKAGVVGALALPVTTLQHRFEELNGRMLQQHIEGQGLLLFGSTGMNYEQSELAQLFSNLCFPGLFVSLESLLRTDGASASGYESDSVLQFAFGPLALLGASREQFDCQVLARSDRVRLEFIARRTIRLLHPDAPLLHKGDRVWTAFSRRPTLFEHQQEVGRLLKRFDTFVLGNQVAASLGQFL